MNKLTAEKRRAVVACLVEGNSIRSTVRMTGVAKATVSKLVVDLGAACMKFHDATVRNVQSNRVECDEIWAFVGSKAKNVPADKVGFWGDIWTWTAIDPETKLILSFLVGGRDAEWASLFMNDVADRLANRVQLTTDGHKAYLSAVESAFGSNVDYTVLEKHYGTPPEGSAAVRYSPVKLQRTEKHYVCGAPDPSHVSTSIVERQNLTMRMSMRRFTRLTNGFSKKIENHAAAVALYFVYYNFARIHKTLRVTPAMEAGLSDHVWSIDEVVALLES